MVKVSVIVPIFNVEKYLKQCVDSLLNQTLKDIEVILVDDGSPDSCPQICDEYEKQDSRIKVIHKKNGGLSDARNAGLELVQGEYVAFIDSDDYVDLQMFEKLFVVCKHRKLDVCFCDYNFDYNGVVKPACKQTDNLIIESESGVKNFLLDMVGPLPEYPSDVKYLVSVWHGIYRTDIIRDFNILYESERLYPSEDLLFHIDYLSRCKSVGYLKDSMYYWRYNPISLSRTYSPQKFDKYVALLLRVKEKLSEHFSYHEYLLHYQRCVYSFFRSIIKYEALGCNEPRVLYRIRTRCSHKLMRSLYESYPICKMVFKHRFFLSCMKFRFSILLYIMCWLENKKQKNI